MHCIEEILSVDENDSCSTSDYPNKLVLYKQVNAGVSCSPCKCDPPQGNVCTAEVVAYTDPSCDDASHIFKYMVPLGAPLCAPIPANMGLAAMADNWITNQPGKCMPTGGEPTGVVEPDHSTAAVFCCHEPIPSL